jgi:hypothetical protein
MSRRTFREPAATVCYQRQVRDEASAAPEIDKLFPRPTKIDLKSARVRPVGKAIAWKIISRYEWLGSLPTFANAFFGIFFGEFCGGVACYATRNMGAGGASTSKTFGLPQTEIAYLARGACVHWAPVGAAPKLINFSARATNAQLAIAYSDTDAGEIGTVYQAAGWVCLGRGSYVYEYVSPKGYVQNQNIIRDMIRKNGGTWGGWHDRLVASGWIAQKSNPKIRYVYVLPRGQKNHALLDIIEGMREPYPKRGGSNPADAPEVTPSGEGESTRPRRSQLDRLRSLCFDPSETRTDEIDRLLEEASNASDRTIAPELLEKGRAWLVTMKALEVRSLPRSESDRLDKRRSELAFELIEMIPPERP